MASRVRSIDISALGVSQFANSVDFLLVKEGRRIAQIVPITVPSTAAGLIGLRFGSEGDPYRINAQGQAYNLDAADQLAGIWLVWLGTSVLNPTGIVEFGLGFIDNRK